MELLTLEHFAGCVNETFTAALNDMDVEFVLVEARPLPTKADNAMRHPRIGEAGIFLVPIAQERAGFLYQAVFN